MSRKYLFMPLLACTRAQECHLCHVNTCLCHFRPAHVAGVSLKYLFMPLQACTRAQESHLSLKYLFMPLQACTRAQESHLCHLNTCLCHFRPAHVYVGHRDKTRADS